MACRWPLDRGPHRQVMGGTILFFHGSCLGPLLLWAGSSTQAICLKVGFRHFITSVTHFGSHRHEISGCELKLWIWSFFMGAKGPGKKSYKLLDLRWPPPYHALFGNPFICHQWGFLLQVWGCLLPGRKADTYLQEPPSSAI